MVGRGVPAAPPGGPGMARPANFDCGLKIKIKIKIKIKSKSKSKRILCKEMG